jgi:Na+-transporting methylmalonyl-CoA/oxaloacetate decarboxylase gamma subunit
MSQSGPSGWMTRAIRPIGVAIMVLGVASLVFGILLLISANISHNEEVNQLKLEQSPTTIDELTAAREQIRDARYQIDSPPLEQNPASPVYQASRNLIIQENGVAIALTNLGNAITLTYTGIGIVILSIGLIVAGFAAFEIAPSISQMKPALAPAPKPPEAHP